MLDLNRDVASLSNFKRNTPEFLRRMREFGRPVVLTVEGKAELVVQDAASYQRLTELAERALQLEITRRAVAEMDAGLGRPAEEMLAEMGKSLARQQRKSAKKNSPVARGVFLTVLPMRLLRPSPWRSGLS